MITMIKQFPPINEEQVVDVEKVLGHPLPEQYRQFLLKYNGGRVKDRVFDIPNEGEDEVRYFYGIELDKLYDLLSNYSIYTDRIPDNLLPMGEDDFGNQICISLAVNDNGKIYFWDHEKEFTPEKSTTLLADSFNAFVNQLREDA